MSVFEGSDQVHAVYVLILSVVLFLVRTDLGHCEAILVASWLQLLSVRVNVPSTGQTHRSEVNFIIRLKIAKKCCLYLDIFSCMKIYVFFFFCSLFAFRLEMHVRCDNQYKTGADGENIFEQPTLFECVGICVLSPAHENVMRGHLVYVLIVKYLSH